ncbi:hypothetical protein ISD58_30795, partial [Pseudomonas aeruginosa]|nr:hypothetical protein [Pseudomonas aeruginosa]
SRLNSAENVRRCLLIRHLSHGEDSRLNRCPGSVDHYRTYIANGGYSAERAAQAIRSGNADLVSFGTAFLANPDLVKRFKHGARLNEADKATFYQGEGRGYIDYPYLEELKSKS